MQVVIIVMHALFLSTLSLRRATPPRTCPQFLTFYFYPRSPCGERPRRTYQQGEKQAFLSTLSLRRATCGCILSTPMLNFYPRSPCGERLLATRVPHPPRQFLSTLSLRRATRPGRTPQAPAPISIHALLAESDQSARRGLAPGGNFYPRSPCGERLVVTAFPGSVDNFYPRSPCGERRRFRASLSAVVTISIHALLAESDCAASNTPAPSRNFYPRSPCGERLEFKLNLINQEKFLSTLSLRRATGTKKLRIPVPAYFYPRSPCGERPRTQSASLSA